MAQSFGFTGTADQVMEVLAGPRQHDRHCQAWRWEQYLADCKIRHANMMEATRQIIARRRAAEDLAESYRTPFTAAEQTDWEHDRARSLAMSE